MNLQKFLENPPPKRKWQSLEKPALTINGRVFTIPELAIVTGFTRNQLRNYQHGGILADMVKRQIERSL